MSRIPSLRCLETFVAVAETGSLAAAAERLGVSVPGLSRRLHELERDVAATLLRRMPRGMELTPAGQSYLSSVSPALTTLRHATEGLRQRPRQSSVRVSVPAALASRWLVPLLPTFNRGNPGVQVDVVTSCVGVDLDAQDSDLAIRLGTGPFRGVTSELLLPVDLFPVCTPAMARLISKPSDLFANPLLEPDHQPGSWPEWMAGAGLAIHPSPTFRIVDHMLIYDTAATGAGIALGIEPLIEPFLAQQRLAVALPIRVRSHRSFHLLARSGNRSTRAVRQFRTWLVGEAQRMQGTRDLQEAQGSASESEL